MDGIQKSFPFPSATVKRGKGPSTRAPLVTWPLSAAQCARLQPQERARAPHAPLRTMSGWLRYPISRHVLAARKSTISPRHSPCCGEIPHRSFQACPATSALWHWTKIHDLQNCICCAQS